MATIIQVARRRAVLGIVYGTTSIGHQQGSGVALFHCSPHRACHRLPPSPTSARARPASSRPSHDSVTFSTGGGGSTAAYDFGTATSLVAAGYTRVADTTTFTVAQGFGWQSGTIKSVDRGTADPLTRDLDYTTNGTFGVNVPAGTHSYTVTLTTGDSGPYAHDQMGVFFEGAQVDSVTTTASQIVTKTYTVTVSDGQLNLQLKDLSGSDPNVTIEGLQIVEL